MDAAPAHGERSSTHFEHFREVWHRKVQELKNFALRSLHKHAAANDDGELDVFEFVLQLFGEHRRAMAAVHVLEEALPLYPSDVELFIPQLTVCLLFGPAEVSRALHRSLLRMCGRSAAFAHRLHYFITAFTLTGAGVDRAGVASLQSLLGEIAREGEGATQRLAAGASASSSSSSGSSGSSASDAGALVGSNTLAQPPATSPGWVATWLAPQARLRTHTHTHTPPAADGDGDGEDTAGLDIDGPWRAGAPRPPPSVQSRSGSSLSSRHSSHSSHSNSPAPPTPSPPPPVPPAPPLAYVAARPRRGGGLGKTVNAFDRLSPGDLWGDPHDPNHNHNHPDTASEPYPAPDDYGPLQQRLLREPQAYATMVRFWDKMCHISRLLGGLRRDTRNDCLRSMLHMCLPDFLPSAAVYAPVGNTCHRVWAIHVDECFAFSTKSRAPILLCLEVIDYANAVPTAAARLARRRRRGPRWWPRDMGLGLGSAFAHHPSTSPAAGAGAPGSPDKAGRGAVSSGGSLLPGRGVSDDSLLRDVNDDGVLGRDGDQRSDVDAIATTPTPRGSGGGGGGTQAVPVSVPAAAGAVAGAGAGAAPEVLAVFHGQEMERKRRLAGLPRTGAARRGGDGAGPADGGTPSDGSSSSSSSVGAGRATALSWGGVFSPRGADAAATTSSDIGQWGLPRMPPTASAASPSALGTGTGLPSLMGLGEALVAPLRGLLLLDEARPSHAIPADAPRAPPATAAGAGAGVVYRGSLSAPTPTGEVLLANGAGSSKGSGAGTWRDSRAAGEEGALLTRSLLSAGGCWEGEEEEDEDGDGDGEGSDGEGYATGDSDSDGDGDGDGAPCPGGEGSGFANGRHHHHHHHHHHYRRRPGPGPAKSSSSDSESLDFHDACGGPSEPPGPFDPCPCPSPPPTTPGAPVTPPAAVTGLRSFASFSDAAWDGAGSLLDRHGPCASSSLDVPTAAAAAAVAAAAPASPPPHGSGSGNNGLSGAGTGGTGGGEVEPDVVFKERWRQKEARLRRESAVGQLRGWRLLPVIVKTCDDLRQEQCAAQLISQMHQILLAGGCESWLRPYDIIALSEDEGLIEAIPDTVSLDALKKKDKHYTTLGDFFERFFGVEGTPAYRKARDNFVRSLAGYSIVCYLLNLKDRHNGNILLDAKGHLIHIDYGFILGKTPGGNMGFEKAPFKLTSEFVELMDGPRSRTFMRFRELCVKTFLELRRNHNRIVLLLEMLSHGNDHLPFFAGNPRRVVAELRRRFRLDLSDRDAMEFVHTLIETSAGNWTTTCYDRYQRCCVGIF